MAALNGNRQAVLGYPDKTFWLIDHRAEPGDAVLCFDEYVSYYLELNSGGGYSSSNIGTLFDEMTLFRGVSEEDVRTRSNRFQRYVSALRCLGRFSV